MSSPNQKATLLVDGEVLKQHILRANERHDAQNVKKYLHHMVQEIRQRFPNTQICVHYFGVRAADKALCPISGKPYEDIDIKQNLRLSALPDAEFETSWSHMFYPFDKQWVLRPESYGKTQLSDEDFMLNEQPKGLLTKLVDAMAEKAVCHRDNRLFVFGDLDNMEYALKTTVGLDMPINQVLLDGDRPYIEEYCWEADPKICNKNIFEEVAAALREPWAHDETLVDCLGLLRGALDEGDKESILMVDFGCVRQYLLDHNMRTSVQNITSLIGQIQSTLPEKISKTLFYHAIIGDSFDSFKRDSLGPEESPVELQLEKGEFSLPGVVLSLGKTQQDKNFPEILNPDKWFVHPSARQEEDFIKNFRQYDVDDRIAYDMALARMNPKIKQVFLLSTDGDFAYSAEQAKQAGLGVALVHLGQKELSARLERAADNVIDVPVNMTELVSRQDEQAIVQQKNRAAERARHREEQRLKRQAARLEVFDEDDEFVTCRFCLSEKKPSKEERWGKTCLAHKKTARKIIEQSRRRGRK